MNTPIVFEIAQLLKEKGFDTPTFYYYENEKLIEPYLENGSSTDTEFRVDLSDLQEYFGKWSNKVSAPTIAEIVMWLYEKHGIWISVELCIVGSDEWEYGYKVFYLPKEFENAKRRAIHLATKESFQEGMSSYSGAWHTPTEAYKAAIEYTLKNLIQ